MLPGVRHHGTPTGVGATLSTRTRQTVQIVLCVYEAKAAIDYATSASGTWTDVTHTLCSRWYTLRKVGDV